MRPSLALAGLSLLFLVAFFVQRGRSAVLAIESDQPLAESIAEQSDLTVVEVMALAEVLGLGVAEVKEAAGEFSRAREQMIEGLAVLTVAGHRDLARALWQEAGKDPTQAILLLRPRPEAILTVRFESMKDRFTSRLAK